MQLEFVQTENEILKSELGQAQEQIATLKMSLANVKILWYIVLILRINNYLFLQTKGDEKSIYERIKELEFKESELLKEAHELREQNDLLEFRIVELEESHDKVCLLFCTIDRAFAKLCKKNINLVSLATKLH